jgi:lysyl-tRNA synthetase, class I
MQTQSKPRPYDLLDFEAVNKQANHLADHIEKYSTEITQILLDYESYEVVKDEIARTLDLLRNLTENQEYFKLRIGGVTSFLPRNQPLYALTCFVIIPSLMASEVHFRIPQSMRDFFPKLLDILNIADLFPNIHVSDKQRIDFLKERTALKIDPETKKTLPVTDAVIFTGTPVHAEQLRFIFDKRTLFIANGAGHNPVVVSKDADINAAVEAVLTLQLYNQGQDCAAPNSILVQSDIYSSFLHLLRDGVSKVGVGNFHDQTCRVGTISDPADLVRIQELLITERVWLDPTTPGIIKAHEAIVEPTIICKPLKEGGNFSEIFAPIIFVQQYDNDGELANYFEDPQYTPGTMYVTLYGTSQYISNLIGRSVGGKVLHDQDSFIHNTHLHAPEVERGTKPYGGNGIGASTLSVNGELICKATLPQRDIFEHIAKPLLDQNLIEEYKKNINSFTEIKEKKIEKLLRLKSNELKENVEVVTSTSYIDLEKTKLHGQRYLKVDNSFVYHLLKSPHTEYISSLPEDHLESIRALRALILRKSSLSIEEFNFLLYVLSKSSDLSITDDQTYQRQFFGHIYQLLLGQDTGPRLSQFLWEINDHKIHELLDV